MDLLLHEGVLVVLIIGQFLILDEQQILEGQLFLIDLIKENSVF